MSSVTYRKHIPLIILAIVAMVMVLEYFLNSKVAPGIQVTAAAVFIRDMTAVINYVAVFVVNIVLLNNNYVNFRQSKSFKDRFMVIWMILWMIALTVVGLYFGHSSSEFSLAQQYTLSEMSSIEQVMAGALWGMYAFQIGLKVRNIEGLALFGAFFVTMLGTAPWGYLNVPAFSEGTMWMLQNINTPVYRSIAIGSAVGAAAAAFRAMIAKEKVLISRE